MAIAFEMTYRDVCIIHFLESLAGFCNKPFDASPSRVSVSSKMTKKRINLWWQTKGYRTNNFTILKPQNWLLLTR